eukprot:TRINITY_DN42905_c0_g1_i1.p1 TRINITY_DN42905_c0_g1~~TRINITY_DN42905_c0_g1_i1.p1  ORF type:complete len:476 (+),score=162.34 TRINITY_DN42905_c0_g1_i1:145-1572(+)
MYDTRQAPYPLRTETLAYLEWIPVRLTFPERKRQRLVKAAVLANDYTTAVDNGALDAPKRKKRMLKEMYHFFLALYVAEHESAAGARMCMEKDLSSAQEEISSAFELARRYKIMNPEIMRMEYGKLLYIIQDALSEEGVGQLGFRAARKIFTVVDLAERLGCRELLDDPDLPLATTPVPRLPNHHDLNRALRTKDRVVKELIAKYSRTRDLKEEVNRLIRSIDDCNCYMQDNHDTIMQMRSELTKYFSPTRPETGFELGISEGEDGSRLSHDHSMQYHYVFQSLTLWKNILRDMYRLWLTMEDDLLNHEHPYDFVDTGQGFNRMQKSPNLYRAMEEVLSKTKREVGGWIGSERIHMGDNQVPNGFNFIDKYANVARIVNPILRTCQQLDTIVKDPGHMKYVADVWGSTDRCKKSILCDFFRHGFDGSGGDNDMDAGSCIDGRLTSAWQWCSLLNTKPYYPIFLLAGFSSFDGDFE